MPDYQQGKIYKIWNVGYDRCYIGSTTETLSSRMSNHRSHYRIWLKHNKGHCRVYDLFNEFGLENCKIELLETYPCNNRSELEAREGHHQRENECVNKNKSGGMTMINNADYAKQYRENNREHISELKKKRYEATKEAIAEKQKQYYETNRCKILEQKKRYCEEKVRLKENSAA